MEREDELRATFDALHAQGTPARPFEAADIIHRGTRKRQAHRTWAVLGTGFATAAAVVTALLLLPKAAPEPVRPAEPPAVTTTVPLTPWNPSTTTGSPASSSLETTQPTSSPMTTRKN